MALRLWCNTGYGEGLAMQAAVGYLRVSTREQGRSGFSLETQRRDIEAFGAREGFTAKSWYQDVQTGGGADALPLRPGLAAALREASSGGVLSSSRGSIACHATCTLLVD
jgi:DNA invertase Pin-like site-specific DNA recombinase